MLKLCRYTLYQTCIHTRSIPQAAYEVDLPFKSTPVLLLQIRLDLRADALQQILCRVLRLPSDRAGAVRPAARVRSSVPAPLLRPEVLDELFDGKGRWLGILCNPECDKGLADRFAELVPSVLAVLAEVEALPAVPGLVGVLDDRVVERDEQVRSCTYGMSNCQ